MGKLANSLYQLRREVLSNTLEVLIRMKARSAARAASSLSPSSISEEQIPANPQTPEDFKPLKNACFQQPYEFYRMLRDQHPVYQLANGIFCISRYQDIVEVSRDVEGYSSTHQGAVAGLKPGQDIEAVGAQFSMMAKLGLTPVLLHTCLDYLKMEQLS